MATGIYAIIHRETGRCYVGQANLISKRWNCHRYELRKGVHHSRYLQRCWDKYGEDAFDFMILEECSPEQLTEREISWGESLCPVFNSRPAMDSNLGSKRSAESRARISAANRGRVTSEETKEKLRIAFSGKKYGTETSEKHQRWHREVGHSPEARARIAAGQRGRKHSPDTLAKMSAAKKGKPWSDKRRAAYEQQRLGSVVPGG
jgi:group I intron endonuclease